MKQPALLRILAKPSKDRPVLDAVATTAEVIADAAMRGDVLEAIPFVNLAVKALKGRDSIRDAFYAEKLVGFVKGIGELTPEDVLRMRQKLSDDDEARKAGETLLLVLDRLTDLDKPELLGFVFRQFADGKFSSTELRRLAVAIDMAFADDLRIVLHRGYEERQALEDAKERLVAAGLARLRFGEGLKDESVVRYVSTPLGQLLFHVVNGFPDPDQEIDTWAPGVDDVR